MNLHFYIEKLQDSLEFKDFLKENPEAYLSSAFFVIDFENSHNQSNLDFYIPSKKETMSFQIGEKIVVAPVQMMDKSIPKKLIGESTMDFKEIESIILSKMSQEKINSKLQKLLFSFQNKDDKDFIFVTAFISALGMLKIIIDPDKKEIVNFEKKSFFDMMNILKKGDK
jgi:hypothetical protein